MTSHAHVTEVVAAAGSKATYAGSGVSVAGWVFSSDFALFVGAVVGVAGFLVNWYYRHKLTNAEIKSKLEELHLKQEQNEREKQEHSVRMNTLRTRRNDHSLCDHEHGICVHGDAIDN